MVLEMCKKHLRGICGDLLDTYNGGDNLIGDNFEVCHCTKVASQIGLIETVCLGIEISSLCPIEYTGS